MEKSILDVIRAAFSPYVETRLLPDGEAVIAVDRRGQNRHCRSCGHPVAYKKGKAGEPLCAACLCLSAKMPCHSDSEKAPASRGLSPCNPKGGGMGILLTQNSLKLYVRQEKFDLVFLDNLNIATVPVVNRNTVWQSSVDDVLALPYRTLYFWGILQTVDIYPVLRMLRTQPWSIAQKMRCFYDGSSMVSDTCESLKYIQLLKAHPKYQRTVRAFTRLLANHLDGMDDAVFQKRFSRLEWEDARCFEWVKKVNRDALLSHFG